MSSGSFPPVNVKPLSARIQAETEKAKKDDKKSHEMLRGLLRRPENKQCADCTADRPGWAVLPHGIFVCINCAQIHRHIGRHISQVKGVSSGTYLWYDDERELMALVGNAAATKVYAGTTTKPKEEASRFEKEEYVRNKYERKKWYNPAAYSRPSSSPPSSSRHTEAAPVETTATKSKFAPSASSKPTPVIPNLMDMLMNEDCAAVMTCGAQHQTLQPVIAQQAIAQSASATTSWEFW